MLRLNLSCGTLESQKGRFCQIGVIQNIEGIHDQFQLPECAKLLGLLACGRFEPKAFREANVQASKAWPLTRVPGYPGRAIILRLLAGMSEGLERRRRAVAQDIEWFSPTRTDDLQPGG